jgi:hypothetical protein
MAAETDASFLEVLAGPVVNPGNGRAYYLLAPSAWTEARAAAESLRGRLATVRNEAEQDWIFQTFGSWGGAQRNLWIGLHDPDPSSNATDPAVRRGEFVWVSGEGVTFTRWDASEPNNSWQDGIPEAYVQIWRPGLGNSGTWNDLPNDPSPFYAVHGVVEAENLNVTFPQDATADCPFTTPDDTGRPVVTSACGGIANVVIEPEDDNRGDLIFRRWVVRDACGQVAEAVQTITVVGFGNALLGEMIQEDSSFGGLLATFAIVDVSDFIGASWFVTEPGSGLETPILSSEEGVEFLNGGRRMRIDCSVFRGGRFGEATAQRNYGLRADVTTRCSSGPVDNGGELPAVFRLSRGVPIASGATASLSDDAGLVQPCGIFENPPQVFRIIVDDAGPVEIRATDETENLRIALRAGPLDRAPPLYIACGQSPLRFIAERRAYFGWVDTLTSFKIEARIAPELTIFRDRTGIQLRVRDRANASLLLQRSTDLQEWLPAGVITCDAQGAATVLLTPDGASRGEFYRLQHPGPMNASAAAD